MEQRLIRHRVPQKIGQAAGRAVVFEFTVGPLLHVEQETGRLQQGLNHHLGAGGKILRCGCLQNEQLLVARHLAVE